ncbi:MAG: O-antigen ligase family protein [Candidatus Edwardsbacteria bacterium]|nr:O-antigen ligase family protein [Candidatus Edwardsbacteria bacterium]
MGWIASGAQFALLGTIIGFALLGYGGFINRWHGIGLLLLMAPFYGFLRFVVGLSSQQIIIKELMVVVITASTLAVHKAIRLTKITRYPHDTILGIFLFLLIVQLLRTPDPVMGVLGLRVLATYIPLYYVIRYENPPVQSVRRMLAVVFTVVIITAVYGLWQAVIGKTRLMELGLDKMGTSIGASGVSNPEALRIFGTYAGPEYFGATLIMTILLAMSLWYKTRLKLLKIILPITAAAMILAVGLTLVRIEWMMLAIGFVILSAILRRYYLIPIMIAMSIIAVLVAPGPIVERARFSFGQEDESYTARTEVYTKWNISNVSENMLGTGLGTTNAASIYGRLGQRNIVTNLLGGGNTESWYTAMAIETGIAGLLVYLWLQVAIIRFGLLIVRTSRDPTLPWLAAGFVSFTGAMLVANAVTPMSACFPAGDLYFWVLLGLLTALYDREQADTPEAVT